MKQSRTGIVIASLYILFILAIIVVVAKSARADDDTCKFQYEDAEAFLAHKNHDVIFRNGFENYCDDDDEGDDDDGTH